MNWLQLGYQYGVGGLFFTVTLILCSRGQGRKNGSDRRTRNACIAGIFGYFAFHLLWIFAAGQ